MFKRRFKRFYRQLRRPFEWLLIGVAYLIIPRLSQRGLARLVDFIANFMFRFDRRSKEIARANLRLMFGGHLSRRREEAIIRQSFKNMARVLGNSFWLFKDTRQRILAQTAFPPGVLDQLKKDLPVIFVSAHIGNWEILTQSLVANGIPVMSVARKLGSKAMTERLVHMRSIIGQQIVPAEGALRPLIASLKKGNSIGLLIDQHINIWEGGAWIQFFGLPTGISQAPAMLARKYQVPIFFGWSRPLKDGGYRIEYGTTFYFDPAISDFERTQQIVTAFERVIRRHPSLWCLNYRRWRYIPLGEDPARYPFYASQACTRTNSLTPAKEPQ